MQFAHFIISIVVSTGNTAIAARIYLANADTESNSLTIPEGATGGMDVRIETVAMDTVQFAFLNAFLNTTDNNFEVVELSHGQSLPWLYDTTSFTLPARLSEDLGNEYALIAGDKTENGGFPVGSSVRVMDTLTILNTQGQSGEKYVTFELGSRQPSAFGPAPTFTPFTTAPHGFPAGIPNFLYIGDDTSTNPEFVITKAVPEPATLGVLVFCAWVVPRRHN